MYVYQKSLCKKLQIIKGRSDRSKSRFVLGAFQIDDVIWNTVGCLIGNVVVVH